MTPVLYSFRRCPYAMRARLALHSAGINTHLREVVLRDKPEAFLQASASGTVPCLVTQRGAIDESLDVMIWALRQRDPEGWLHMPEAGWKLIERCDGAFKQALDRTKYASRYPDADPEAQRRAAMRYLSDIAEELDDWLFDGPSVADYAILPFVRQFAFIDKARFDAEASAQVRAWLDRFLASPAFAAIMLKYPQWRPGDQPTPFPSPDAS